MAPDELKKKGKDAIVAPDVWLNASMACEPGVPPIVPVYVAGMRARLYEFAPVAVTNIVIGPFAVAGSFGTVAPLTEFMNELLFGSPTMSIVAVLPLIPSLIMVN
jgi:hypothetical protein